MKFHLIDRVLELERGRRIKAVKAVSLSEEYLAGHFPTFPVLPGVFMLQAMVEAGSWLVREARDFDPPLLLLKGVRGVTYKSFVAPGRLLHIEVTCVDLGDEASSFSASGKCDGQEVVKGRFTLTHVYPSRHAPQMLEAERRIVEEARRHWAILSRQADMVSVVGA